MFTLTKNLFLPTEDNKNLPIFLSSFAATFLGILASVIILSPVTIHKLQLAQLLGGPAFAPADVVRLINADRAKNGLGSLRQNDLLNLAASAKAADMIQKDYFAHTAPNGKTPWDFIRGAGYAYSAAGENLAMDFTSAESTERALMNSPTHRANILNKLYTEIGVAVVSGDYGNRPSIFVVQYFGKPAVQSVQSPKIKDLSGAGSLVKPLPPPVKPADILPKSPSAVLGTETESKAVDSAIASVSENSLNLPVRAAGFLVVLFLLVVIALSLLRLHTLPFGVLFRTLALVIIFGYIATHDLVKVESASITPISFSTVTEVAR